MIRRWLISVLAAVGALCIPFSVMAQKPASVPQQNGPPLMLAAPAWQSGPYWADFDHRLLVDFGNLERFRAADLEVASRPMDNDRVVFIGDSITEGWKLESAFPGKPYINRGISGQTSSQILLRFRQDVIDLHPRVAVILAGTNDLAENTGPVTLAEIEGNLESMAQLAAANHIGVVLCSLLPSANYWWHSQLPNPTPRIAALNQWLEAYAARQHYAFVDYYGAMRDSAGALRHNLSSDGVHPSSAGYAVMAPLAQTGIDEALKQGYSKPGHRRQGGQEISIRRLSGPIYLVEDGHYDLTNSIIYVGPRSVTVVGAMWTPEDARVLAEKIKTITNQPIREVIDTSPDPEWSGGNEYWKRVGVRIVAIDITAALLQKTWAATVEACRKNHPTYPEVPLVSPTAVYAQRFELQNGSIRGFYLGPSHTDGDIFVYFPRQKVLDAGSILKEELGNMAKANVKEYPLTLHKLQALHLDVRTIVSGHWTPIHGPELVDHYLELLRVSAQGGRSRKTP